MIESNDVRVINVVPALSAQELNVAVAVMDENQYRRSIEHMGADDGRLVVGVSVARKVNHKGKLQAHA